MSRAVDIFYNVSLWFFIVTYALQLYNVLVRKDIPNIRTAPALTDKIIELLKQDYEARKDTEKPYTIIDLGSGNGWLTRQIAKALPEAQVIGLELFRHTCAIARWRQRCAGLKNIEYVRTDFFKYDLSKASAITMYLLPYLMQRMGEKLHKETRPGTLITSNKFKLFDGWVPQESLQIKTLYLHQGKLHVYRSEGQKVESAR